MTRTFYPPGSLGHYHNVSKFVFDDMTAGLDSGTGSASGAGLGTDQAGFADIS